MLEKTRILRLDDDADAAVTTRRVSWGAIFAGLFVSLVVYAILAFLGLAIGAETLPQVIQGNGTAQGLSVGASIWMMVTILVSLFAGGYAAGEISGRIPMRTGRVQGTVVASLFFLLMFAQAGLVVGAIGSGVGDAVKLVGRGVANSNILSNVGDSAVLRGLANLTFKSSPETVAAGIATRVLRGDTEAALTYLSWETGISRQDAEARINQVTAEVQQAAADAAVATANAVKATAWALFGSILLGTFFAILGGGLSVKRMRRLRGEETSAYAA